MSAGPEWGPLARLAGIWEGEKGEDVAYANDSGKIGLTPYREHIDFKPFGPVENGSQVLYGLDYRMAAWRGDEEQPLPHRGGLLDVGRPGQRGRPLLPHSPRLGHRGRWHR